MKDLVVIDNIYFFKFGDSPDMTISKYRYVEFKNLTELGTLLEELPYDLYNKSIDRFSLNERILHDRVDHINGGFIQLINLGDQEYLFIQKEKISLEHKKCLSYATYKEFVNEYKKEAKYLDKLKKEFPENLTRRERIMYLAKIYETRKLVNNLAINIKLSRLEKNKAMSELDKFCKLYK